MIEDIDAITLGDEEPEPRFNKATVYLVLAIVGWLIAIGECIWLYQHKDYYNQDIVTCSYSMPDRVTPC